MSRPGRVVLLIAATFTWGCGDEAAPASAPTDDRVFYRADMPASLQAQVEAGRRVFVREFEGADGLGDGAGSFNGRSCAECHHRPSLGGGGDDDDARLCILPDPHNPTDVTVVHSRNLRGAAVRPCPPSAERRRAPPLYGLGWTLDPARVDRLAGDVAARAGAVPVQHMVRDNVGTLLLLGRQPFSRDVREFTAIALRSELGVTPDTGGAYPEQERDGDAVADPELPRADFEALVAFLTWLDFPPRGGEHAAGEAVFERIGCGGCHVREPVAGFGAQYRSFAVTDLGPHFAAANLRDWGVDPGERVVTTLRGLGDRLRRGDRLHSDGSQPDLDGSMRVVHQGAARPSSEAWVALPATDRAALQGFLETL